jgi:hypothetical protein
MRDSILFRIWHFPQYGEDYTYSKALYEVILMNFESRDEVLFRVHEEGSKETKEVRISNAKVNVLFDEPLNFYVTGFILEGSGKFRYVRERFVTDKFAQEHAQEHRDKFKKLEIT